MKDNFSNPKFNSTQIIFLIKSIQFLDLIDNFMTFSFIFIKNYAKTI